MHHPTADHRKNNKFNSFV